MPHISLRAEEIFNIWGLPVTNTLIVSTTAVFLLFLLALVLKRRLALVPGSMQNMAEVVTEGMLGIMDSVLIERKKSEKYLPLVATIFLFIVTSNWLGLLPGVGSLGLYEEHGFSPLFRSPASDLNFTLAIAIVTVITINLLGIIAIGTGRHISKFFNFTHPVKFFIGILEFISEIAKIISFSFRLFGNVFAGEVLLVIIAFLVPIFVPLPFLFLEIFVGFIQAFIFAMLALVFIAIATAEQDGH